MRPGAVAIATCAFCGVTASAPVWAAGFAARVEAGTEYDSNPTRLETFEGVSEVRPRLPSAALRLAVLAELDHALSERFALAVTAGAAGRRLLVPEAQGEDLLVAEGRASLFARITDGWSLSAYGAYYDVVQRADSLEDARDFRSLAPGARLQGAIGRGRIFAGGGWRWFQFKPAPVLDFRGPTASLGYRHNPVFSLDGAAEWDWGFGAAIEERHFAASACAEGAADCVAQPARRDHFLSFDADVTRTGDQLWGLGLFAQNNRSDRFGETLWRFGAHLRTVCPLPFDFALTGRAELVLTRYADGVPIGHDTTSGAFVTIEEEGRSSLRIDLSHPVTPAGEAGLRFTLYTQAPGSLIGFSRHLVLAYLAWSLGR